MIALVCASTHRRGRRRSCRSRRPRDRCRAARGRWRCRAWRAALRFSSIGSMSRNALSAPVWNVIASWISKSRRTRPSETPRPYSTETSGVNVRTWLARRRCSRDESGAARNASRRCESDVDQRRDLGVRPARAARVSAASPPARAASARDADLRAVGRREHAPEALGERSLLSGGDRELVRQRRGDGAEGVPHARLVGVQQIGAQGGRGRRRRERCPRRAARSRPWHPARPAELRRRPELAYQQPARGRGRVAALRGLERELVAGGRERCPGLRGRRPPGAVSSPAQQRVRARARAASRTARSAGAAASGPRRSTPVFALGQRDRGSRLGRASRGSATGRRCRAAPAPASPPARGCSPRARTRPPGRAARARAGASSARPSPARP